MKTIKIASFYLFACLLFLSACKNDVTFKEDALVTVPAEVNSVTAFHPNQLMEKADFKSFQQQELYQNILKRVAETDPSFAAILKDPTESGIDLDKNIYINTHISSEVMGETFTYAIASIKDKSKLDAFLNAATNIEDFPNGKLSLQKGNIVFAWNDKNVLIGKSSIYNGDSKAWAKKIFATTQETSIAGNADLKAHLASGHDITNWTNSTSLASNPQVVMMAGMINISESDLKDNSILSYIDFEKGSVVGKSDFKLKKGLTKDVDLLFKDKVKTDFSPFIPSKDLVLVTTAALDWKGLNQVLSEQSLSKSMIDRNLRQYGINTSELTSILEGDLIFAGYGKQADSKEIDKSIFIAPIADEALLRKALGVAIQYEMIEKIDEQTYLINMDKFRSGKQGNIDISFDSGKLLIKDKMLFITGNEALLNQLREGELPQAERISKKRLSDMSGYIASGIMDVFAMGKFSPSVWNEKIENIKFDATRKAANFNLNMVDKNNNSLKSFLQYLNEAYKNDQFQLDLDLNKTM
ncbi:MAG: DUF4836 family protein [Saprospiraceae bacterium]